MTILDRIIKTKRAEVAAASVRRPLPDLQVGAAGREPTRDFYRAVTSPSRHGVQLIAEIKKASPSAGLIVADFNAVTIARTYHRHGAAALSVLTDETYFQGHLSLIDAVKRDVTLPVLRKDFIIDEYQLYEARAAGADAVLLIAEVLAADGVAELSLLARKLSMCPLVEVHSVDVMERIIDAVGLPGPTTYLLGINNRDLHLQQTDLGTTTLLASLLPSGAPFVAESGISTPEHVRMIRQAGARAMLVGESLLRAPDMKEQIDSLLGR